MPSSSAMKACRRVWVMHALAGVDQHHGEVGGRRAGRHVAGVLLVTRRVGDDEPAPLGGEEAVGDVDRDALLALASSPSTSKREIEIVAGGAVRGSRARAPRAGRRGSSWCRTAAGRSAWICRHRRCRRSGSAASARGAGARPRAVIRSSPPASCVPSSPLRRGRSAGRCARRYARRCISATISSSVAAFETRPRRSADSSRASGSGPARCGSSPGRAAASARHRTTIRLPSRSTTGCSAAKYSGTIGICSRARYSARYRARSNSRAGTRGSTSPSLTRPLYSRQNSGR